MTLTVTNSHNIAKKFEFDKWILQYLSKLVKATAIKISMFQTLSTRSYR